MATVSTTPGCPVESTEIFGPDGGLSRVADKLRARAGMLMINQPTAGVDYHAPFGGTASPSYGSHEQGRAARHFYTTVKTSYQLPL